MKNVLFTTFRILIFLVLIGKVLNWFLNFNDEANQILNMAMFTLIGIAYIVIGYVWDNKLLKVVIATCGMFLIVINFFKNNLALDIIGIVCILTPMLIARFYKRENGEMNVPES